MHTLAATVFAVPFVSCAAWAGQPPAFSDLGYAEAMAANGAAGDRLLIVKFTAE